MTTDSTSAYLRTKVLTANPEQLRLMLLDGAIKFARQGREGLTANNHEQIYIGFNRSRDIVVELLTSVRPDTEPTLRARVQGLYTFIFKLLVDANFDKDPGKADKAIELLEFERETWQLAIQKLAEERKGAPAAHPTPSVTSGPGSRPALSVQG
jgi:flagellar protein FliS